MAKRGEGLVERLEGVAARKGLGVEAESSRDNVTSFKHRASGGLLWV